MSIGTAIDLFDTTVSACPDATWEACVDRAWAVLYWHLDWPPYYLRRLGARTRGCEALAVAVKGVSSFNLAARQPTTAIQPTWGRRSGAATGSRS
jgi:hypothetical protein